MKKQLKKIERKEKKEIIYKQHHLKKKIEAKKKGKTCFHIDNSSSGNKARNMPKF